MSDEIQIGDRVEAVEGRYFGTTGEVTAIEEHLKGWWIFVRRDSDGEVLRMWYCNLAKEVK